MYHMEKIGKFLLKTLLRIFGLLPLKVHYVISHFIAWIAESVIGYRRDEVAINLAKSFPEKDYGEVTLIRKDFYLHFADIIVETIWFGASNAKRLRKQRIVEIVNPEVIAHLYEVAPSVVVMYSHCGNWELYGGIENYNYKDTPTYIREDNSCVVYKKMSSKLWDSIMAENRCAPLHDPEGFHGYLESNDVVRYIFNHKGEKKFYNFNTDQSPYQNSAANMDIEFMHQQTRTMTASAVLASKFGMAVAYLNMRPECRGHYLLEYTTICEDASKMSPGEIMGRYYELLEKDINALPYNYLWTHRRWK